MRKDAEPFTWPASFLFYFTLPFLIDRTPIIYIVLRNLICFSFDFLILFISALKAYILCRQQQRRYEAALPLFFYIIYSPVYPCILSNHRSLIQYGLLIGQN